MEIPFFFIFAIVIMITDMKKTFTFLTIMLLFAVVSAQTVSVTFTGRDASNQYIPLNRVVVSNLTRGWQETLFWPDTVLVMTDGTGIDDFVTDGSHLSQNNPNPFDGTTYVNLNVTEPGEVSLVITDITGRIVGANNYSPLQPGIHEIRISLSSAGIYFLTARQNGRTSSVKMVNSGNGNGNTIAFTGTVEANNYSPLSQPKNAHKGLTDNPFVAGDQMEYVGITTHSGEEIESKHVIQTLNASQIMLLLFIIPQPCPDAPTVTDIDGNLYNTLLLGTQCWMRENLRTTKGKDGNFLNDATTSGTSSNTEPYYYDYSSSEIAWEKRGYLYNWPAAMVACPSGWHLPSDYEWYVMEATQVTNPSVLANDIWRGDHAGRLTGEGWNPSSAAGAPGDTLDIHHNASLFSAVPAGYWYNGSFIDSGINTSFWTSSTEGSNFAWERYFRFNEVGVFRYFHYRYLPKSVRCLRD